MMRITLLCLLAGCSLYFGEDFSGAPEPDGGGGGSGSDGGGNCPSYGCNTCGFQPQPQDTCTPGASCDYEDWEHGCSCGCNEDGKWQCFNETVGSHCTTGTYSD